MGHRIPLHNPSAADISVHRQTMLNMSGGKGFRPDFMERTMVECGFVEPGYFKADQSGRSRLKAINRRRTELLCEHNPRGLKARFAKTNWNKIRVEVEAQVRKEFGL